MKMGRLLVLLLACAICHGVQAQDPEGPTKDALERGTPASSARGFLLAAGEQDYEKAAQYLDLRNLPSEVLAIGGAELARQLNLVLSRTIWFEDYSLDDTPSGRQGDGLPDYRDELVRIPADGGEVTLFMQRVPREDGEMIWKISNRSVAEIPALYDRLAHAPWVDWVRTRLPEGVAPLGLELYKWVISLGVALLAWPLLHLAGLAVTRLFVNREHPMYPLVRSVMTRPMVALGIAVLISWVLHRLGLGVIAQHYAEAKTVLTIVAIWVLWSIIGLYQKFKSERLREQGREGAARIMRPVGNLLRLLVLLAGLLFWLSNLGVNISTVLAGLGIGGLALALALQKPIEDLMGALTLFSQQPMRVGDFCKYQNIIGIVEDIGLRTTRIRTLDDTVVCIPNSRIAHSEIENYTARERFHYKPVLRLRYDSTPEQVRNIIQGITDMLRAHPRVLEDIVRVRFTDFTEDSILIKVHCYVDSGDFTQFLEIAEELNLKIMDIVEGESAAFALPSRMLYGTPQSPAVTG